LHLRPFRAQRRPFRAGKDVLAGPIGELGIGDRNLAEEALGIGFSPCSHTGNDAMLQQLIDQHVDPAQEEARDRGNLVDRMPAPTRRSNALK